MSRDQLASALYAWGEEIESNAIDVHLHHLRKKLSPDIVQTLRGVGYIMPKEIQ
jgi:two-component system OmpR family response regulator/two-component system response regulator QseB